MQIVEAAAKPVKEQVANMVSLPFIHSHVAVIPDVHVSIGARVGKVIPAIDAVVPEIARG